MENEIDIKIIEPKIGDVPAIHGEYGAKITHDTIKDYIEEPLVEACEILYNKNIRTLSSTANLGTGDEGIANIIIDYESLSERNRDIARNVLNIKPRPKKGSPGMDILLEIPVKKESTVREISSRAKGMAQKFVKQKPTWIKGITLEEVEREWKIGSGPEVLEYLKETYYHDTANDLFYPNEEYYKKVVEASLEDTQRIKITEDDPEEDDEEIKVKILN